MTKKLNVRNLVILLMCNTIGTGVFFLPKIILQNALTIPVALSCWIVAATISILLGLCYSELGSSLPFEGGDAVYLKNAFGQTASNVFSFTSVVAILPLGSALITNNIISSFDLNKKYQLLITIGLITCLALINFSGNSLVFKLQYILTILKMIVVAIFVILAFLVFSRVIKVCHNEKSALEEIFIERKSEKNYFLGITIALFSTLWSYDGWNSGNFIAHQIYKPYKTLPVAITLTIVIVCFIYTLINLAYFYVLPYNTLTLSNNNLMFDYFNNLNIPNSMRKFFVFLVNVIPSLGTLNGSFLVSTAIIDSFINDRKNKNQLKPLALGLFSIFIVILCQQKKISAILDKINFFVFLFYGLSVSSIFFIRKKNKDVLKKYKANNGVIIFCIFFSSLVVIFAIGKQIYNYSNQNNI